MSEPTLGEVLQQASLHLRGSGFDCPELDVRLLCEAATGWDRTQQFLRKDEAWPDTSLLIFQHLIQRRAAREPVGRILGQREFWGLPFLLSPATLEPRPDSETLIEAALDAQPDRTAVRKILDLGTGTGCLLAALLMEYPAAEGIAVDQSAEAAATARQNFERLGLDERSHVLVGNWADGLSGQFDLIISNPPYIGLDEVLAPEVSRHDPAAALFAGHDGLSAYREIMPGLAALLNKGGFVVLEVGVKQSALVIALGHEAGLTHIITRPDLNGIPRAVVLARPV